MHGDPATWPRSVRDDLDSDSSRLVRGWTEPHPIPKAWRLWEQASPFLMRWLRMRRVEGSGPILRVLLGVAGVLAAFGLGKSYGWIGYILGPSLGAALMFAILCAAAVGWVAIQNLLFRGIPWLPACRNGCCRGGRLAGLRDYKPVWNENCTLGGFRCRCGIVYQKVGRRFVE